MYSIYPIKDTKLEIVNYNIYLYCRNIYYNL